MNHSNNLYIKESQHVVMSRLLLLKPIVDKLGGSFEVEHRFQINIGLGNKQLTLKLNLLDGEFYLIDEKQAVILFRSVAEIKTWIKIEFANRTAAG